ncbi:MAG: lysylphosphatidylglycerol synthase transmembrane domain-containing protein, partial [Candidatus Bilamarchaeaceae archaeon]
VISLIIVAALLHYAGIEEFLEILSKINLGWLLISIILLLCMYSIMIVRMKILLDEMHAKIPWIGLAKTHFTGMLLADLTPARSGYLGAAVVMNKNYGIPYDKAMVAILGPQAYDFMFKIILGGIALLFIVNYAMIGDGWIIFSGIAALGGVLAIMVALLFSKKFLGLFSFSEKWPFFGSIYRIFMGAQTHSGAIIRKTPHLLALLFCTWAFKALSWFAAAKSVGMAIQWAYPEPFFFFFFQPLVTILEFVPTPTIAGMGLSETGGVFILSLFGIEAAQATAFLLVARFKTMLVNLVGIEEAIKLLEKK